MREHRTPVSPRVGFWLAAALFCASPANVTPGEDSSGDAQVSVKGLRLVARPYKGEQTMRAFNWFTGTTLALQVDVAKGGLIELDAQASQLDEVTDDKGTDLLKRENPETIRKSGVGGLAMFSEDGKAAMIEVNAPRTPHPAAAEIRAKGTLAFRQATIKKTYKDVVTLQKKASVNAGPIHFTIAKVGKPDWGNEALGLTLRSTQDPSAITSVRFLDVKGSPIVSRKLGSMRTGLDQVKFDISFALTKKVDVVMIEIDYWEDLQTVTVPFDVKASVGFAGRE